MNAIERALRVASRQTDTNPSEKQKEASNYKKGRVQIHGLTVAIENPKGSERSGIDRDGKPWKCVLPAHYGDIKRTTGADGDAVDCYIGPDHDSDKVFIVDQVDAKTGKFDEHKTFLSYGSKDSALADYRKAFSDGKGQDRIGHVTEMSVETFRDWLKHGDTTKPLATGYASGGLVKGALALARTYKADGGGTPRSIIYDEYGQPHDAVTGDKIAPREAPAPSLTQSLKNIALSPYELAKGAVMAPVEAAQRLPSELNLTGVPELDRTAHDDAMTLLMSGFGGEAFSGGRSALADAAALGTKNAAERELLPDSMMKLASDRGQATKGAGTAESAATHMPFDESQAFRAYHGTSSPVDFSKLLPGDAQWHGKAVYVSRQPEIANHFAQFDDQTPTPDNSRVFPLDVSGPLASRSELSDILVSNGYDMDAAQRTILNRGYTGVDGASTGDPFTGIAMYRPGSVRSATTGETLFSDTSKPSLVGSALAGSGNRPGVMSGIKDWLTGKASRDWAEEQERSAQAANTAEALNRIRGRLFDNRLGDNSSGNSSPTPAPAVLPKPTYDPEQLARAQAQGFDTDTPYYHGTMRNFDAFDSDAPAATERNMPSIYLAPDPAIASMYSREMDGSMVYPTFVRKGNHIAIDAAGTLPYHELAAAKNAGYDSVLARNVPHKVDAYGNPTASHDELVVFDPANIRSTNAAFDPANAGKNGLLLSDTSATSLPGALIAGAPQTTDDQPYAHGGPVMSDHGTKDRARKLHQAIALAMSVVRKGQPKPQKADGGGVLDDLAANPHGWGSGPAISSASSPLAAPMWKGRALDALTNSVAARDAIGEPDFDTAVGLGQGVRDVGGALSGLDLASEGGQALGRGDYGTGALDVGMAALPGLGPLGRGLTTAMKYAPKSTVGALSLLGATTFPAAASDGSADPMKGLYADQASLRSQLDNAMAVRDAEGQSGKGPKYQAADEDVRRLQTQKAAMDSMIQRKEQENSPEHAQDLAQRQKGIDAANAKVAASTPIRDQYPWLPTALTATGLTASAALPFLLKAKGNLGTFLPRSFPGQLDAATSAAESAIASQSAPEALRRAKELDGLLASQPTALGEAGKAGLAALSGGALAGEASMLPDQYDAYNLPDGPAKDAARSRALNPINYAERGAMGALTGLSGYETGNLVPSRAANIAKAKAVSESIRSPDYADELAVVRRNLGVPEDGLAPPPSPQSGPLSPGGSASPIVSRTEERPPLGLPDRAGATDIETAPISPDQQPSPALQKALSIAKAQTGIPASSPVFSPDDLASDKASKILKEFPNLGVNQWQHGDQVVHRIAPGNPDAGQFTVAPQPPKASTKPVKGKGKLSVVQGPDDNVDVDRLIKPAKDPDDPTLLNRGQANGGLISRAMDVAMRYARGGVVVGPVIGKTGGRADMLPVSVPAGAYVLPADCVNALGGSNSLAGVQVLDKMFGSQASRAAGGNVPIKISDGEYVVSPETVAKIGKGDPDHGTHILNKFVQSVRADHIKTLKSLPPPSR